VYDCRLRAGAPQAGPVPVRWVAMGGTARLPLSKLERMILQRLKNPRDRARTLPRG